jgi:Glyoxalase superfamily protein
MRKLWRALRDALKAKAVETTHAEALELIAKAFGYDNWNILSAKIEAAEQATSNDVALREEATTPPTTPTRPSSLLPRRCTAHSLTPFSESTSTRRWSTSCLPCSMT